MTADWTIKERRYAGEEHLDPAKVARYDEKSPFDPSRELELLKELGLSDEDTFVDFGARTGVVSLAVAEYCDRVVAIDIPEAMVDVVRKKASDRGIQNVELVHAGLVSYEHDGDPASFAFSKNALHHLPDFWKVEALKAVGDTLEPGGTFRLRDLVYSFEPRESHEAIETWLEEMKSTDFTDEELRTHFREEFSTYGFLLEAMLEEAGFEILDSAYSEEFCAEYTCEWQGE